MPRAKGVPHRVFLEGMDFNWLKVQKRIAGSSWECECKCGALVIVTTYQLKSGKTKSCGCWSRTRTTKHGMEGTPIYNAWAAMKSRCTNSKNKWFHRYGGRGISVCDRWMSFENFYADMGKKPEGMTLDRINNDGNYEPSNCRWASVKDQIRNREVSPKYSVNGEMKSLALLAEEYGIPRRRLYQRMEAGWSIEEALSVVKSNSWRSRERKSA